MAGYFKTLPCSQVCDSHPAEVTQQEWNMQGCGLKSLMDRTGAGCKARLLAGKGCNTETPGSEIISIYYTAFAQADKGLLLQTQL